LLGDTGAEIIDGWIPKAIGLESRAAFGSKRAKALFFDEYTAPLIRC
jgi:hypothetical protein